MNKLTISNLCVCPVLNKSTELCEKCSRVMGIVLFANFVFFPTLPTPPYSAVTREKPQVEAGAK